MSLHGLILGWEHDSNGTRRIIWGAARQVDATQISILPHAIQLADGSIDPIPNRRATDPASRWTRSAMATLGTA